MQPGRMTPGASELSVEGKHEAIDIANHATVPGADLPGTQHRLASSLTGAVLDHFAARSPAFEGEVSALPVDPGILPPPLRTVGGFPADLLRQAIGDEQFGRWFKEKTSLSIKGEELLVSAGSSFHGNLIQKHFRPELGRVAETLIGPHGRVRFETKARDRAVVTPQSSPTSSREQAVNYERQPTTCAAPLAELTSASMSGDSVSERSEKVTLRRRPGELVEFVVGPGAELAYAAVRQLVADPQAAPNPLYLYGATGLGKTHLIEAVHRQLHRQYPELATAFLTAEHFANLFTQALREHRLPGFRQRFRSIDVLIVDDIDFFDGKRGLQEEFLHTIQHLQGKGRLVVLTADRHPRLLTKTSEELRSRVAAGLVCRIDAPDRETRREIVRRKLTATPEALSVDAIEYVAERFSGNVREIEGAVHCLVTHHRLLGRRIGVAVARQALGELERDCVRVVRLADIDRAVSTLFGLEPEALKSSRRTREVSQPRMLAMYLARNLTRSAYSEIGAYFGGRNHSTVIAAERRVTETVGQSESWRIAARQWAVSDLVETLTQQIMAG